MKKILSIFDWIAIAISVFGVLIGISAVWSQGTECYHGRCDTGHPNASFFETKTTFGQAALFLPASMFSVENEEYRRQSYTGGGQVIGGFAFLLLVLAYIGIYTIRKNDDWWANMPNSLKWTYAAAEIYRFYWIGITIFCVLQFHNGIFLFQYESSGY